MMDSRRSDRRGWLGRIDFIGDQLPGRSGFLPIPPRIERRSRIRAGGFGKRHMRAACTIAVMTTPARQARLYTRRLRNTQRLQSRPGRRADGFARSAAAPGEDTTLATPGALALRRLANRLAAYAPHDGAFQLRLPGTYAIRLSRMTTEASLRHAGALRCASRAGRQGRDAWP